MELEKRAEYEDFITNHADEHEAMLFIYDELQEELILAPDDRDLVELIAEVVDCLNVLEEEEEFSR